VGSSKEDIEAFKATWNEIPRVTREVFAPEVYETIDVSVDTRQYEIRLSEDIAKGIKWQTVIPYRIPLIKGPKSTNCSCHRIHSSRDTSSATERYASTRFNCPYQTSTNFSILIK
jgi:hypothetical protein